MNPPCLYECRVSHTRVAPKRHAFHYRVFMLAIDLDDFPLTAFLSRNRFNLFSIDDRDHIHTDTTKTTAQISQHGSRKMARQSPPMLVSHCLLFHAFLAIRSTLSLSTTSIVIQANSSRWLPRSPILFVK